MLHEHKVRKDPLGNNRISSLDDGFSSSSALSEFLAEVQCHPFFGVHITLAELVIEA